MAKPRKIGVGDTVTLEVICSSDIVDGKWTFRLDAQIVTVRLDLDEIKKVVPFAPDHQRFGGKAFRRRQDAKKPPRRTGAATVL